jgi:hypothetical protein
MSLRRNSLAAIALASCALLGACADATDAVADLSPLAPVVQRSTGHALLECPSDVAVESAGDVGVLGGTVGLAGVAMRVPLGGVLSLTRFQLAVPASRHMEVAISPAGMRHYLFKTPVSITIDYSRCPDAVLEKGPLTIYHIDETSKALLEEMGGIDDRANRRITFTTDHLSGYAIAN